MSYVILMALLVRKSEDLPEFSLQVVLIGLFLSPIAGFISYYYFQRS
jgi:hypothetical protein